VSEPFPSPTIPADSRTEVFLRYLDFFRSRVTAKIQAMPDAELRSSRLPSGWTPLELVKHLRYVELRWLEWGFEGRHVGDPWGDREDDRWSVGPQETAATLLADLRAQAVRSRAITGRRASTASHGSRPGPREHHRPQPGRCHPDGVAVTDANPVPVRGCTAPVLVGLLWYALVQALAQALDPRPQQVARPQVHRRLASVAHPAAGAGGDQVAGPQGDRLAGVGDDLSR
jgi:hypothetical protein